MHEIFSTLAGIVYVTGYFPYINAIIHRTTKPIKTSWLIFALLDLVSVSAMYSKGVLNGQILGALTGSTIIMILSFAFGTSDWKKLDMFCLMGACVGLFLWWVLDNATIGIVISVAIMFVGCIPTFISAWHRPENENRTAWTLYFLSCIFQILAISTWSIASAVQPIGFAVMESIMIFLLWIRPSFSGT